ncbi:hypothetical protein ACFT7S_22115 [Streptomyces sp. NPDC057136]|uniref:hypothetical protein n=1 Tax=Streptomyces sp. NPDC057136 TaxID=3346029 RepID=UPI00363061BC
MSNHDRAAALRARREERNNSGNRQPATLHTSERPADLVITSDMIPAPVDVEATGDLSHEEIHDLAVCEGAVESLATATWLAGKALQAICKRRLYRRTHATFGTYVEERWEISERAAYQMMEEWPLAGHLAQALGRPATASHTRALLPVATRFGLDAAADLYQQLRDRSADENLRLTAAITGQVAKAILKNAGRQADETQFKEATQQLMATKILPPPTAPRPSHTLTTAPQPAAMAADPQNFAENPARTTPAHAELGAAKPDATPPPDTAPSKPQSEASPVSAAAAIDAQILAAEREGLPLTLW